MNRCFGTTLIVATCLGATLAARGLRDASLQGRQASPVERRVGLPPTGTATLREIWNGSNLVVVARVRRVPEPQVHSGGYVGREIVFTVTEILKTSGKVSAGSEIAVLFFGGTAELGGVTYETEHMHPTVQLDEELLLLVRSVGTTGAYFFTAHPMNLIRLPSSPTATLVLGPFARLTELRTQQNLTREALFSLLRSFGG